MIPIALCALSPCSWSWPAFSKATGPTRWFTLMAPHIMQLALPPGDPLQNVAINNSLIGSAPDPHPAVRIIDDDSRLVQKGDCADDASLDELEPTTASPACIEVSGLDLSPSPVLQVSISKAMPDRGIAFISILLWRFLWMLGQF